MRIGIDARLNAYRQGGIAQYTRQLLAALAAEARSETFVALQHHSQRRPLVIAPNVERATLFTPPHNRFEAWSLPVELLPRRLALLHCPDFIAPRRRPCPAVVTVHDLAFLHFPEILDAEARRFYGQVHAAVHDADAVITVSEATRADIVKLLDLPPERIDVVYEAADPRFAPLNLAAGEQRIINGQVLTAGGFLLFVSTVEPRKNLETLLRALRICRDRRPRAGYRLVVAGSRGWLDEPIYALVGTLGLGEVVHFLGAVDPEDLPWLYSACRIYLNPSLYEGFGLPALEALACGAPSIVADTSSLPEVVGDAAYLLPPQDVGAWAERIASLWDDETTRAELVQRGPQHAATFSWRRAAQETLAIYRRVAGRAALGEHGR
ncbi:MAG: glycosyltransferase family 4 protein [Chloroflexi bacterium]|nr:glycosyltransferase family 4 protein [Chloroflexota bacterium]